MRANHLRKVPKVKKLIRNLSGKRGITFTFIHENHDRIKQFHTQSGKSPYQIQKQFPDNVTNIEMNYVHEDTDIRVFKQTKPHLFDFLSSQSRKLLGWRVDLTPISKCKNLQSLYLERNDMPDIDLRPLENCETLDTISFKNNCLRSIDLTPLKSCTNLKEIYLDYNELDSIDLDPLASCINLRKISLRKNQLRSINLLPLSKCSSFEELDIEHNNLTDVDLTPLCACHNLSKLKLTDGNSLNLRFSINAWAPLRAIAAGSFNQIQTQYVLFNNLHLLKFGMIDSPILNEISNIPPDTPIEKAREDVKKILIQKMCDQIDAGGTTIGLEIDDIIKEGISADLIIRAQKVVDLRKEEMNRVAVTWNQDIWEGRAVVESPNDGPDKYDLRPLWLTAYGNRILRALEMQQRTDGDSLKGISDACKKIGHDLEIFSYLEDDYLLPTEMSSQLQKLILNLVDSNADAIQQNMNS